MRVYREDAAGRSSNLNRFGGQCAGRGENPRLGILEGEQRIHGRR